MEEQLWALRDRVQKTASGHGAAEQGAEHLQGSLRPALGGSQHLQCEGELLTQENESLPDELSNLTSVLEAPSFQEHTVSNQHSKPGTQMSAQSTVGNCKILQQQASELREENRALRVDVAGCQDDSGW